MTGEALAAVSTSSTHPQSRKSPVYQIWKLQIYPIRKCPLWSGSTAAKLGMVKVGFGLTPRRYQSGEHDNPGRISKAGDRDVRAALYAAANALLMRTMAGSQIKSWGMRLMRTKGRRRAIVAVARKLAVLMHRMWIDGTEFRQEQVGGTA